MENEQDCTLEYKQLLNLLSFHNYKVTKSFENKFMSVATTTTTKRIRDVFDMQKNLLFPQKSICPPCAFQKQTSKMVKKEGPCREKS